nr:immunoglobulin light chain junction region [Macaca mulatta]MOV77988.1 immunoglobulin light chain junction region [Macaca mulatta]MOV78247.1 immunoglobulin light chain junction region [Macaca mulatta]MOV78265.1 immunoglobulin light chain junction region [Macaca mulatta]MOV78331.1 immunoglobulin light chain junction region [Macaca mulatta]
CMQTLEFPLTF